MEIPSYFHRYLKEIQPHLASRTRAKQLHKTLRERLEKDGSFQDWHVDSFLYGSYIRNTALNPIKDVDVCVVLALDTNNHAPQSVVDRLRRVLERNNYSGKTALQRRSVRIDMSGPTLDVVPVVPVQGQDYFLIPNRKLDRWEPTHPKAHIDAARRLNDEGGGKYVPFVKIVKAWHKYQQCQLRKIERPKPKGFTIEALVAQYQDPDAPSYAEAFVNFLDKLWSSCGSMLKQGRFPEVCDPGKPTQVLKLNVDENEARRFGEIVESSLYAARQALDLDGTVRESAEAWARILGPAFPTKPNITSAQARLMRRTHKDAWEAPVELADDISAIDLPEPEPVRLGRLTLSARISPVQDGPYTEHYPSNGRSLPKDMWLEFRIADTNISGPYEIWWLVKNHGEEAREAEDMGHEAHGQSRAERRATRYRGTHTMTCELRRDGRVLARAKYVVNIK